MGGGLHKDLLFAADAAEFRALKIRRGEPRCVVEPAAQNYFASERRCFAREDDEDGLRDFFGVLRILRVTKGDGMDKPDMATHDLGKGFLGFVFGEFFEESGVGRVYHSTTICARMGKGDKLFVGSECQNVFRIGMSR
jgi:hypothetical protein